MPETSVWILDASDNACPPGKDGEVFIATEHRTLGYFKQAEATRKVFREIKPAATVAYATGDIGMQLPDGSFKLLGRKDRQVKVGGVRIEPEEVEKALLGLPPLCLPVSVRESVSRKAPCRLRRGTA